MSRKQFLALLLFYVSYLFFGASVYYTLEQDLETADRAEKLEKRIQINDLLLQNLNIDNETAIREVLNQLSDYCEFPVTHPIDDEFVDPYIWTFYHAFFFSFTVISTVGYGNISPNSTFGRMFMLFYATIGLPANAIMFANLGEIFGQTFEKLYSKYKNYKMSNNKNYVALKLSLYAQMTLYLVPGMLIFIFLPACLFSYFEKWPYEVSVYYAFVTLTTIGFGDYAASFQPSQPREFGNLFVVYEIFIIFWFIFGLGYIVMIMGYLIKAYKSKQIAKLEHQLSATIKGAQNKLWNGVTHDVSYIRKLINEITFAARVKPVYVDEEEKFFKLLSTKSSSCPDLTMYRDPESDLSFKAMRKRTMSESYYRYDKEIDNSQMQSLLHLNRTQSDSDLQKIDREKTFAALNENIKSRELLTRVANVLGNISKEVEDEVEFTPNVGMTGVHGFSDSQILASERTWSGWSSHSPTPPVERHPRCRACSETKIPIPEQSNDSYEWTWSGSNSQIKDLRKLRQKSQNDDLYKTSFQMPKTFNQQSNSNTVISMPSPSESTPTGSNRLINKIFRKRAVSTTTNSLESQLPSNIHKDAIKYLQATANRDARNRCYSVCSRRGSVYDTMDNEQAQVLETTTIGDLIRALEDIHSKATTSDSPKRKMGTASLTPPEFPSIFGLFEPDPSAIREASRRQSLRRNSVTPNYSRRPSVAHATISGSLRPPPYSSLDATNLFKRRFSVRPISSHSPSISSLTSNSSSLLQPPPVARKISLRPSPLARQSSTQSDGPRRSSRFSKPVPLQREVVAQNVRRAQGSLSNLPEKFYIDKKRTDSK